MHEARYTIGLCPESFAFSGSVVGAPPRIHGELLKLGFEIAESTVSKYMIRHRGLL